jgi:3-hydroxymyristoyl/3-hydroxydecanoyl-(acyl carrier protein) dehydratase
MNASSRLVKPDPASPPVAQTYPLVFFDRVLEQTPDSLELLKNASADEWSSPAGEPLPGWVVLEVMAQAAGRLGQTLEPGTDYRFRLLSRIKRARFRRRVLTGDQLRIQVNLIKIFNHALAIHAAVRTQAGRVADADFYFFRF